MQKIATNIQSKRELAKFIKIKVAGRREENKSEHFYYPPRHPMYAISYFWTGLVAVYTVRGISGGISGGISEVPNMVPWRAFLPLLKYSCITLKSSNEVFSSK